MPELLSFNNEIKVRIQDRSCYRRRTQSKETYAFLVRTRSRVMLHPPRTAFMISAITRSIGVMIKPAKPQH